MTAGLRSLAAFAALALVLVLLAACGKRAQEPLFQPFFSKQPEHPLEIVAEKTLTKADELPRDYRQALSARMPPQSREIATFNARAGNGPLRVVLDYAALALEDAEYPEHRAVSAYVSYACPELKGGCFANGSSVQSGEFYVSALNPSGVTKRDMYIDGKKRTVYFGHTLFTADIAPSTAVTVSVAFKPPPRFETHQLRVTLLYGDYAMKAPSRLPAFVRNYGRYAAAAALVLLAAFWWRVAREERHADFDAPRLLGFLVLVLGVVMSAVGFMGDYYFLTIGVLYACTGVLLRLGFAAARWAMTLAVIVVWWWTIADVGFVLGRDLLVRTTVPTLIWLYVMSPPVSRRLGSSKPA